MKPFIIITAALAVNLFVAACVDNQHYPISGQECTADDPVADIDPAVTDCIPLP